MGEVGDVSARAGVRTVLIILLQLLSQPVHAQESTVVFMKTYELYALRMFWFAWNQSTPDTETNLAGWKTFDYRYYANYGFVNNTDPCYGQQWRGLVCARQKINETASNAQIIGLVLNDASIVGNFPNNTIALKTMDSLSLLILTGNRGLTGPVPDFVDAPIKILDLNSNGFSGEFPWLGLYRDLEYLDLSNNGFTGEFRPSGQQATYIRTLKLSFNGFNGTIDDTDSNYNNWLNPQSLDASPLVTVDLAYNEFTGQFCNLTKAIHLKSLDVSNNLLSGEVSAGMFNSSGMPFFRSLDLSYNNFNGSIPDLSSSCYALTTLDLSWNPFDPAPFPQWMTSHKSLRTLGLSGVNLIGEFNTSWFFGMTKLRTLVLENNSINGTFDIDKFYAIYDERPSYLSFFSFRNNNITNVTYNGRVTDLRAWLTFDLHGNPFCNNSTGGSDLQRCLCDYYCVDTIPANVPKRSITLVIILAATLSGALVSLVIFIAAIFILKNKREKRKLLLAVHERFAEYELKPTLFAYGELAKSTRNFHVDLKLGQGAFGAVYKGKLLDGSTVAIKQLHTTTQQSMDDFLNEVVLLTSAKHRNLVKLKGCCLRGSQRLLVYEYMEKYDLADVLFDRKGNQILDWPTRLNICTGVAQGLHYLHALVEPKIIHRDIKASNILLDKNAQAKIADFGLAMLFPDEETHIMTIHVAGTKGYMAPEYATFGQVSEKVDVFSFGVLVLEVVSGRRNIDLSYTPNKAYLAEWAWSCYNEGKLLDLVDPTLVLKSEEEVQVEDVINVALLCIQMAVERRPSMAHVVAMLQGDLDIGEVEHHSSQQVLKSMDTILELGTSSTTILTTEETQSLVSSVELSVR